MEASDQYLLFICFLFLLMLWRRKMNDLFSSFGYLKEQSEVNRSHGPGYINYVMLIIKEETVGQTSYITLLSVCTKLPRLNQYF